MPDDPNELPPETDPETAETGSGEEAEENPLNRLGVVEAQIEDLYAILDRHGMR